MFNAFEKLRNSLAKTKDQLLGRIAQVITRRALDDDLIDEIEESYRSDIGVKATSRLMRIFAGAPKMRVS